MAMDKFEKQLGELEQAASKQGARIEEIEAAIRKELEKSQFSNAVKKATEERIINSVRAHENKAIFGLDTSATTNSEPLVMLPNGMVIKAEALAL